MHVYFLLNEHFIPTHNGNTGNQNVLCARLSFLRENFVTRLVRDERLLSSNVRALFGVAATKRFAIWV